MCLFHDVEIYLYTMFLIRRGLPGNKNIQHFKIKNEGQLFHDNTALWNDIYLAVLVRVYL